MATPSQKQASSLLRRSPAFRALVVVVLVVSFGLEILSCALVECVAVVPAERSGHAFCLESLQLCNNYDSSFGVLFDFPVLLMRTPGLFPSMQARWRLQDPGFFAHDGFHASIDHPPHLAT